MSGLNIKVRMSNCVLITGSKYDHSNTLSSCDKSRKTRETKRGGYGAAGEKTIHESMHQGIHETDADCIWEHKAYY